MFPKRSERTLVFDLSGCHNWSASPCAGIAAVSQDAPDNELLDIVAASQILDACLSLCSAWLWWPSLCFWPLLLVSLLTAGKALPALLACSSHDQSYRGSGDWVGSSFDLTAGGGGEEFQPSEKVEEAAAERAGAAESAGSVRPPGRGLCLLLSLHLLKGELVGKGSPTLQTYCALKFHWFLVQKFHAMSILSTIMIFFLAIIFEENENACCHSSPKTWLHSLASNISTLLYRCICAYIYNIESLYII